MRAGETPAKRSKSSKSQEEKIPAEIRSGRNTIGDRLTFGEELIASEAYLKEGTPRFSSSTANLVPEAGYGGEEARCQGRHYPALMRAHADPIPQWRTLTWVKQLAHTGFLDILSIGTSQLTQSNFGEEWGEKPNGGGVPINSAADYEQVWAQSRPLLLRTYAGTKNVPHLAAIHEETINICWHALSFWWFNQLDGRGPYGLLENLRQHVDTVRYIVQTQKPLEANVSHHFAFRGADDVTYIVSAYLAAKLAKKMGIRTFVLQNMLNTPRQTWGLQDC